MAGRSEGRLGGNERVDQWPLVPSEKVACSVSLLGPLHLTLYGRRVDSTAWRSKKAMTLFALLLSARGAGVPKEQIIDHLWPDVPQEKAAGSLHTTVYYLRQSLKPYCGDAPVITYSRGAYRFDPPGGCHYDVDDLEKAFHGAQVGFQTPLPADGARISDGDGVSRKERLQHLLRVVSLYRGPFLADEPYAEWVAPMREKYRSLYVQGAFEAATILSEDGQVDASIDLFQRALAEDSYRDDIHAALIQCYIQGGRPAKAVAHYDRYRQMLWDDLGLMPGKAIARYMEAMPAAHGRL